MVDKSTDLSFCIQKLSYPNSEAASLLGYLQTKQNTGTINYFSLSESDNTCLATRVLPDLKIAYFAIKVMIGFRFYSYDVSKNIVIFYKNAELPYSDDYILFVKGA